MAIIKGKDGSVSIGGVNLGRVASFSLSIEADVLETTFMGQSVKRNDGSLKSWTASAEVHATTETQISSNNIINAQDLLGASTSPHNLTAGSEVSVSLTDGNTIWSGAAIVTSVSTDVNVADIVTVSLDLTGNGALTTA